MTPFLILGNPENRRITMFADALERRGHPAPEIIAHQTLLEEGPAVLAQVKGPRLVKLDSFGENDVVTRALLRRGLPRARQEGIRIYDALDEPIRRGLISSPMQSFFGFTDYLESLRPFLERDDFKMMNPITGILELFDKRVTSRRYASLGIPVPEFIDPATPDALRVMMRERGWSSCFVKLACSSSASCLAVVRRRETADGDRFSLMTTIARRPHGWFNSLRIQRVDREEDVDVILTFLLRDGAQVERHVPKAKLARRFMDCRVLVVDEEPAFTVVRTSTHPITNLHLGGVRGDLDALRRVVPPDVWAEAMEACVSVARAHGCFYVGVDLMFERGFRGFRVIEANAFGDLLPNLTREGLDVFEWEIDRFSRR